VADLLTEAPDYRGLAADIVSAYVSHNALSYTDLPKLLTETHNQLRALGPSKVVTPPLKVSPAVKVGKSLTHEAVVCLYCGKTFKSLKRHLSTDHHASPVAYRAAFGLPADYPMVSPAYSASRSQLAKSFGLGQKRPVS